jgi:hypothetical protein
MREGGKRADGFVNPLILPPFLTIICEQVLRVSLGVYLTVGAEMGRNGALWGNRA